MIQLTDRTSSNTIKGMNATLKCLNRENKYQQGAKEKQHIGQLKIIDHWTQFSIPQKQSHQYV